nr:hypothetical protein Csa_3G103570 [Ipomoea batatas]
MVDIVSYIPGGVEPVDFVNRNGPIVDHPELRRLNVAEDGDNLLLGLHEKRQFVKTKVGLAVARRENGDAYLAFGDGAVDLLEQLVARFHVLVVQERPDPEPGQPVVQQRRHRPLRVHASVVYENVDARRRRPPHHRSSAPRH